MAGNNPIVTPLQASVHRMLNELTYPIIDPASYCDAEPDSTHVTVLAEALRTVLSEHRLDPSGHCERCHGRRGPLSRRRGRLPCRAYLAVQLALGEGGEDPTTEIPRMRHHHHRRRKPAVNCTGC